MRKLKLAIVGHGRAGKDTAAEWFRDHTPLVYTAGTSEILLPFVVVRKYFKYFMPIEDCTPDRFPAAFSMEWESRHQNREFWFETGVLVRKNDPAFLARTAIAQGQDIVVGIRDESEIKMTREEGLVDLVIWIDRDVPPDPTLTYGVEQADIVVPNRWGLDAFHARLGRLAKSLGLPVGRDPRVVSPEAHGIDRPPVGGLIPDRAGVEWVEARAVHPIQAARDDRDFSRASP